MKGTPVVAATILVVVSTTAFAQSNAYSGNLSSTPRPYAPPPPPPLPTPTPSPIPQSSAPGYDPSTNYGRGAPSQTEGNVQQPNGGVSPYGPGQQPQPLPDNGDPSH